MAKETKKTVLDPEMLTETIKEQTKDTIKSLLGGELRNYLNEAIKDDEDETETTVTDDVKASEEPAADVEEPAKDTESSDEAPAEEPVEEPIEDTPEVSEPEEGDDWADFGKYSVGDGEYDLTGEKDLKKVAKVWKKLGDDEDVIITQQDDNVRLTDNQTGAEYLIELDPEKECEEPEFELTLNEENEFTDDYQKDDVLDADEPYDAPTPTKTRKIDAGAPDSKEKPWAGPSEKEGDPFDQSVNEENIFEVAIGEDEDECSLEEGDRTLPKKFHMVKQSSDEERPNGVHGHAMSANGEYVGTTNESVLKKLAQIQEENKVLKSSLVKFRKALNESVVTNANIGWFAKLVIENSTTAEEKRMIVERFDKEAKTLEQGKALYESLNSELKRTKASAPKIDEQINIPAEKTINENKIYENEDATLNESMDLMRRMNLL